MRRRTIIDKDPYAGYNFVGEFAADSTPEDWYYQLNSITYDEEYDSWYEDPYPEKIYLPVDPVTKMFKAYIPKPTGVVSMYYNQFYKIKSILKFPDLSWFAWMPRFQNCPYLEEVHMAAIEKRVGFPIYDNMAGRGLESAFYGCDRLRIASIDNIRCHQTSQAFQKCPALESVEITNCAFGSPFSADEPDFAFMFEGCKSLKHIDLFNTTMTHPYSSPYFIVLDMFNEASQDIAYVRCNRAIQELFTSNGSRGTFYDTVWDLTD